MILFLGPPIQIDYILLRIEFWLCNLKLEAVHVILEA